MHGCLRKPFAIRLEFSGKKGENMKQIIMERIGCSDKKAEAIEKRLQKICPELKPVLEEWLESGKEEYDKQYEGFTISSLMKEYGMQFTGALLTIDWLIRDPETAKEAIKEGIK